MYFGDWAATMTGNLNVCPTDATWVKADGLCKSTGVFTPDVSKEGGKVLIHSTSKAGGITAGADSALLMKACITNGGSLPTGAAAVNLKNML